jgi:hypothetical protein
MTPSLLSPEGRFRRTVSQHRSLRFAVVPNRKQPEEPERLREQLTKAETELAAVRADLAELGRAHEAQARHLVVERLSVAENAAALLAEIEELKADVEWRKGVMKVYEDELGILRNSRSVRYSAQIRRAARALRPRRT